LNSINSIDKKYLAKQIYILLLKCYANGDIKELEKETNFTQRLLNITTADISAFDKGISRKNNPIHLSSNTKSTLKNTIFNDKATIVFTEIEKIIQYTDDYIDNDINNEKKINQNRINDWLSIRKNKTKNSNDPEIVNFLSLQDKVSQSKNNTIEKFDLNDSNYNSVIDFEEFKISILNIFLGYNIVIHPEESSKSLIYDTQNNIVTFEKINYELQYDPNDKTLKRMRDSRDLCVLMKRDKTAKNFCVIFSYEEKENYPSKTKYIIRLYESTKDHIPTKNSIQRGQSENLLKYEFTFELKSMTEPIPYIINNVEIGKIQYIFDSNSINEFNKKYKKKGPDHTVEINLFDETMEKIQKWVSIDSETNDRDRHNFTFQAIKENRLSTYTIDISFYDFVFDNLIVNKTDKNYLQIRNNFKTFITKYNAIKNDLKNKLKALNTGAFKICKNRNDEGEYINKQIFLFKKALQAIYNKKNKNNPVLLQDVPGFNDYFIDKHTFDVFEKYNENDFKPTIDKSDIMKSIFDEWKNEESQENNDEEYENFSKISEFSVFDVFSIGIEERHKRDIYRFQYIKNNELLKLLNTVKFNDMCKNLRVFDKNVSFNKLHEIILIIKRDIINNSEDVNTINKISKENSTKKSETLDTDTYKLTEKIISLNVPDLTTLFIIVDTKLKALDDIFSNNTQIQYSEFLKYLTEIFDAVYNLNSTTAIGILNNTKNGNYKGDILLTNEIKKGLGIQTDEPPVNKIVQPPVINKPAIIKPIKYPKTNVSKKIFSNASGKGNNNRKFTSRKILKPWK